MSIRVGIGSLMAPALPPGDLWRWVEQCEEGGIDSIWYSDQMLGPFLEPITMLAALAARTRRMRFGMNALVVAYRDPVLVAKQCATINYLAEGRLLPMFGVGAASDGYWAATGRASGDRGRSSNEAIRLIRAMLGQDQVAFDGDFHRYHGPGAWPRPAKPIPLWIGGDSEAAIQRTATLGDGWIGGFTSPEKARDVVDRIKAALVQTGRSIDADHYGVTLPFRIGAPDDPAVEAARDRFRARLKPTDERVLAEMFAAGDAGTIIDLLRRHVAAGISKFVMLPMASDAADLMAQTELLAREILPVVEDRQPAIA